MSSANEVIKRAVAAKKFIGGSFNSTTMAPTGEDVMQTVAAEKPIGDSSNSATMWHTEEDVKRAVAAEKLMWDVKKEVDEKLKKLPHDLNQMGTADKKKLLKELAIPMEPLYKAIEEAEGAKADEALRAYGAAMTHNGMLSRGLGLVEKLPSSMSASEPRDPRPWLPWELED